MQIAVVAPAGPVDRAKVEASIALITQWGHAVHLGRHLFDRHLHCAGTAEARSRDLGWALTEPGIDAVWLARGGYGVVHCLPSLSAEPFEDRLIIGSSDATALLAALWRRGHPGLVHGTMVQYLAADVDNATQSATKMMLTSEEPRSFEVQHVCGPIDDVDGVLVGGNLSVLASLAGTPWSLEQPDAVLLLEDVGEPPYRLDRALAQLQFSGMLAQCRAIVLGEFIRSAPAHNAGYSHTDVLRDCLGSLNIPVMSGAPVGHGVTNLPWRFGAACRLSGRMLHVGEPPPVKSQEASSPSPVGSVQGFDADVE